MILKKKKRDEKKRNEPFYNNIITKTLIQMCLKWNMQCAYIKE